MAEASGLPLYLTKQNCRAFDCGAKSNWSEAVWKQVAADIKTFDVTKIIVIGRWERFVTADQCREGIERMLGIGATVYVQKVVPNAPHIDPLARAAGEWLAPFSAADYARDYAVEIATFAELARHHPGPCYRRSGPDPLPPTRSVPQRRARQTALHRQGSSDHVGPDP